MENLEKYIGIFNKLPSWLKAISCAFVTCIAIALVVLIFGPGSLIALMFFAMISVIFWIMFE